MKKIWIIYEGTKEVPYAFAFNEKRALELVEECDEVRGNEENPAWAAMLPLDEEGRVMPQKP